MRVLLIEDDSATAQSIELMLKSESFNVYTTDLGEEGVDLGKGGAGDGQVGGTGGEVARRVVFDQRPSGIVQRPRGDLAAASGGDILQAGTTGTPYYTNSSQLPV